VSGYTAAGLTTAQISALREEAVVGGLSHIRIWCELALAQHEWAHADGSSLIAPTGAVTTRTAARQFLADMINASRAGWPE
jgi:hypothetical protein